MQGMPAAIRSNTFYSPLLYLRTSKNKIYVTVSSPLLCGCQTCTVKEKVLRKTRRPKRQDVKRHKEEVHHFYPSPNKSRRVKWTGNVACVREKVNAYRVLVEQPEAMRRLGRPKSKWRYNVKKDINGTGQQCMNWIHLIQDRKKWRVFVNTVMNFRVP